VKDNKDYKMAAESILENWNRKTTFDLILYCYNAISFAAVILNKID